MWARACCRRCWHFLLTATVAHVLWLMCRAFCHIPDGSSWKVLEWRRRRQRQRPPASGARPRRKKSSGDEQAQTSREARVAWTTRTRTKKRSVSSLPDTIKHSRFEVSFFEKTDRSHGNGSGDDLPQRRGGGAGIKERRDHEYAISIRGPIVFSGCVCIGNGIVCVGAVDSAKINLENLITRTRTGPLRCLRWYSRIWQWWLRGLFVTLHTLSWLCHFPKYVPPIQLNLCLEFTNLELYYFKLTRMNCTKWNARTAIWDRSSHAPVLESPASDDFKSVESRDVVCPSGSLPVGWSLPGDTKTVRWHHVTPCIGFWVFCTMKGVCLAEKLYLTVYIYRFQDLCMDYIFYDNSDNSCNSKNPTCQVVFNHPGPALILYTNPGNDVRWVLDNFIPTRLWQCAIYIRRIHNVMSVHLYTRT